MTRVSEWRAWLCQRWAPELCSIAMNSRVMLLSVCLLAWTAQASETKVQLWKWTDANGVVHYSDVPGPGAVRVGVSVDQGSGGDSASSSDAEQGSDASAGSEGGEGSYVPPASSIYRSLTIQSPDDQASFFDANAVVNVQIGLEPALAKGDSIYLFLDGKRVTDGGNAMAYSLSNIVRGEHRLQAIVYDADGVEKIRSAPVTIYMKQPTVIPPNAVGPDLRPKPTPRGN